MTPHLRHLSGLREGVAFSLDYSAPWPRWWIKADYDPLADRLKRDPVRILAWEFLRRSPTYQDDWMEWKFLDGTCRMDGNEEMVRIADVRAADICTRYGILGLSNPVTGASIDFSQDLGATRSGFDWLVIEGVPGYSDLNLEAGVGSGPTVTARFSLDRPMAPQLKELRDLVGILEQALSVPRRRPKLQFGPLVTYLRILDGEADGARRQELIRTIYNGREDTFDKARRAALKLRDGGYRDLFDSQFSPIAWGARSGIRD